MTLRSARTEYLLELTQKLDDIGQRMQALRDEVASASTTDASPSSGDRAQDIAQDEQRALDALRSSASRLGDLAQRTVSDIDSLLEQR